MTDETPDDGAEDAPAGDSPEDVAGEAEAVAALAEADVDPEAIAALAERTDEIHTVLDLVAVATAALDDEAVRSLGATGATLGGLAGRATDEDALRVLDSGLVALGEAGASDPEPAGALDMVRALRDPDVREGLGFLISMAKAFGSELREREA